jgi:RNA recognition motif-containing protein
MLAPEIVCQVFVGNLPFRVTWQELKEKFESAGPVVRADVLQAKGRSRGFGRVGFSDFESASQAISLFDGSEWDGRVLAVRADAQEDASRALYVGNLPFSVAWQPLKDLFKQAGTVERADVPLDAQKRSKGFGLVVMQTVEQALQAQEMFHNFEWNGRFLDVRQDKNFHEGPTKDNQNFQREPPREREPQREGEVPKERNAQQEKYVEPTRAQTPTDDKRETTSLFVGNLPYSVDADQVTDLFAEFGIEKVTIALDAYGKSRGYAQVQMQSASDASEAIEKLNGAEVSGRPIIVRYDTKRGTIATPLVPNSQVYVGNVKTSNNQLPFNLRWQDLKDLFRTGFTPLHASVALDSETGRSRGYGIVRFSTQKEAEAAVTEMNGATISGRVVSVRMDKFTSDAGVDSVTAQVEELAV